MKILIIGAGPAGVSTVETLRQLDHQVEITMLSDEPYLPYSPPAMVDHFLTGADTHLWRAADWPRQMGVDYRQGVKVVAIQPEAHRVQLAEGPVLPYDRLVIATGSRLYAPIQGADLPGIYNFKSLSAAEALIGRVRSGEAHTALIVGAGFIGLEIALLLAELGVKVTQIEMLDQVMAAMLDAETAAIVLTQVRNRGVEVRLKTKADAFVGNGRASGVRLDSGEVLTADLLIAATGVKPNLVFLEGSAIAHQWGISVDNHLRTSAPDVYAAGDVVEAPDRLTGEHYVHAIFPNAVEQGRIVAMNLAGYPIEYEGAERMNSLKHLRVPVMAVGQKQGDTILREQWTGSSRTIYLQEGRIAGFQLVGNIRAAGVLRSLLNQRREVRELKQHLLDVNFGEGTLAWSALAGYV